MRGFAIAAHRKLPDGRVERVPFEVVGVYPTYHDAASRMDSLARAQVEPFVLRIWHACVLQQWRPLWNTNM